MKLSKRNSYLAALFESYRFYSLETATIWLILLLCCNCNSWLGDNSFVNSEIGFLLCSNLCAFVSWEKSQAIKTKYIRCYFYLWIWLESHAVTFCFCASIVWRAGWSTVLICILLFTILWLWLCFHAPWRVVFIIIIIIFSLCTVVLIDLFCTD